jgi:hypothetical protein
VSKPLATLTALCAATTMGAIFAGVLAPNALLWAGGLIALASVFGVVALLVRSEEETLWSLVHAYAAQASTAPTDDEVDDTNVDSADQGTVPASPRHRSRLSSFAARQEA